MDNKTFRALSSKTRIEIMKRILKEERHLSELSREMGISKPVILRHIRILEDAGLIKRKKIGNLHLLKANIGALEESLETFAEEAQVEVGKGKTVFEVLKQFPDIRTREYDGNEFIYSVNGDEGIYIYEVDGHLPEKAINEYLIEKSIVIQLKKLIPITKKRIKVKVEDK